ncbi:hypothetical protein GCM10009827_056820 [Dactylosporangium maewongense]|uniref:Uncharacterized protein n=1 Tax=Dactylosporangium maewongense TaxID=634393 RepID=A0ABN2B360_9ACTN
MPAGVTLGRYDGPCTITKAGTVISAKLVKCDLEIRVANVWTNNRLDNGTAIANKPS